MVSSKFTTYTAELLNITLMDLFVLKVSSLLNLCQYIFVNMIKEDKMVSFCFLPSNRALTSFLAVGSARDVKLRIHH